MPLISHAPLSDGRWTEQEWRSSVRLAFAGNDAHDLRLAWSCEGLWIGALLRDATPVAGRTPAGESLHQEDVFEFFFDAAGISRCYFELQISRNGRAFFKTFRLLAAPETTASERLTREFNRRHLRQQVTRLPPGLRYAVGSSDRHWVVEILVPRRLLLPGAVPRANFAVHDWDLSMESPRRRGHFYYWSKVEPGCPQISPTRMGKLAVMGE